MTVVAEIAEPKKAAASEPQKEEPGAVINALHGVILLSLFALIILTGEAADNVSRTPQLRSEHHVPYLREVALTLPIFVIPPRLLLYL